MNKIFILSFLFFLLIPCSASAADWYARPYRPGGYGSSDGTSYENAFNGIDTVRALDMNAIQPGDNLYVCGFHDGGGYDYSDYWPRPVIFFWKSGAENNSITIRGDCPGDPGTIFGSGMQFNDGWTLHDAGNNIYKRTYTPLPNNYETLDQAFERHKSADKVNGIVRLNKPGNANFASWQPGSYFLEGNNTLYYKPASGSANNYTFYTGFEYPNIATSSYTVIKNINLMSSSNPSFGSNIGIRELVDHVVVENVSTRWGAGVSIGIGQPNEYITIRNCTIRDSKLGIYIYGTAKHIQIIGNDIGYFNYDGYYGNGNDVHGIALQGGGDDMIIEGNHIHHGGGEGVVWYFDPGWSTHLTNVAIRYNHVHDMIDFNYHHNQRGIEFGGHNISVSTVYNNSIHSNIIHDIGNPADDSGSGIGIRLKAPHNTANGYSWSVYNNVVYNVSFGLVWLHDNNASKGPGFEFMNNIIMNPRSRHIFIYTQIGATYNYDNMVMDNNIYYPDGPNLFVYPNPSSTASLTSDFQGWQNAIQKDQNSMSGNPLFVSPVSDFHLQANSPAIDNGTDVGLTIDFEGNPVPLGAAPDIGAYEFSAFSQCTENDWNYTDGPCQPNNTLTRTWTKTGSCQGGVTHPNNETIACVYSQLPGDINGDGTVDIIDLGVLGTHFGQSNTHPAWNATADVVSNNKIDIYDLIFVASRFT